jgi:hypothetical protein
LPAAYIDGGDDWEYFCSWEGKGTLSGRWLELTAPHLDSLAYLCLFYLFEVFCYGIFGFDLTFAVLGILFVGDVGGMSSEAELRTDNEVWERLFV